MICRIDFQFGTRCARTSRDNRSRPVRHGVLTWRCRTINCWRNRVFSASNSERLRGRSANVPVTRLELAGCVIRRKKWLAAVDRRVHRRLAKQANWFNNRMMPQSGVILHGGRGV